MAEFKIGRLRFNWAGEWATGVEYNRDAIVQHDGKSYVCLIPHTSNEFNDDLAHVTPGGALTPYWTLMMDGKKWVGDWTTGTRYNIGNIAVFGGTAYTCTTAHVSTTFIADSANWAIYTYFDKWGNDWQPNYAYGPGDVVKYGGLVYRCISAHVSANTSTLGLEDNLSAWEILYKGIEYKGEWSSSSVRYKLNDVVRSGPSLQICNTGHTSSATFDLTKWDLWLPGTEYSNTWSNGTTYQLGEVVKYGGYVYVSISENNIGNVPSTSTANWNVLNQGYEFQGDWTNGGSYKIGSLVRRNGRLYEAIVDNAGQDPVAMAINTTYTAAGSSGTTLKVASTTGIVKGMVISAVGFRLGQTVVSVVDSNTVVIDREPDGTLTNTQPISFVGVNYLYWKVVVLGTEWRGPWDNSSTYVPGDLVAWKNTTYVCIRTPSNEITNPESDANNMYWIVYAAHARKNALTTFGDIEVYKNGKYDSVGIGTQDYTLRITNSLPTWKHINTIPRVFYVAPSGIDTLESDHGLTWDKPWQTIKYACDIVAQGTENPNAAALLRNNKSFLTTEMYQWMLYQKNHPAGVGTAPFTPSSTFDQAKTIRDAEYIIDAIVYDITRGGNSQTVAATLAYFAVESTTELFSAEVLAQREFIVASLTRLGYLIQQVLNNQAPSTNYQNANNVPVNQQVSQVFGDPAETNQATTKVSSQTLCASLINIVITALTNISTATVPAPNDGANVTIMVKTGSYAETLPLKVSANVAIWGDELRSVVVEPKVKIKMSCTSTSSVDDTVTVNTTIDLEPNMPVHFVAPQVNNIPTPFGGITAGINYYVVGGTITPTTFKISTTPGGLPITLSNGAGIMLVWAGDCVVDMFHMRNGSGVRNMTLTGLVGTLSAPDEFTLKRPTGPSYVSLDPGAGANDTSAWIYRRSPYVQGVTAFGEGCVALKIDGTLHNGGNKSIVANDFTHILSDGIGVYCTGPGALTEVISVFSYYGYSGYMAEDGGRIRAANGNSSYGTYGVIATGYDITEAPVTGNVYNQSQQVQATVQSAFGTTANLIKLAYANAGSNYNSTTTNLLNYSNNFLGADWQTDGNLSFSKITTAPTGLTEGWTFIGNTANTGENYIYQIVPITPAGATYTAVSAVNISGSGQDATFDVTVTSTGYVVSVNYGGTGYVSQNQLYISGGQLGGVNNVNDCIITVEGLSGSVITTVSVTGTVPTNSNLNYTASIFVKKGTSDTVDIEGIFSGSSTVSSKISYNFNTGTLTPSHINGGFLPTHYGIIEGSMDDGWVRLWVAINDTTGLNNQLEFRLYPRGTVGAAGEYSYFYGAQLELSPSDFKPSFYLEVTDTSKYTAYANFNITGSGTGVVAIGSETRSRSVFQTRVTDTGLGPGGSGYLTSSNNAQTGDKYFVQLAQSDTNTNANYTGMRVFINSGTGAGQYGYISYFNEGTKDAFVLKESFKSLEVTTTASSGNLLTLQSALDTSTLYVDQPVQFIPTYYNTSVSATSLAQVTVTEAVGGTTNTLTVSSTVGLLENMSVTFNGSTFSTITPNYAYYIYAILDDVTIQITEQPFGNIWPLTSATGSMTMNFTANNSYISGSTTNMIVNYPIQFTGSSIGGLLVGTNYYINDVIDASHFTVSSSLVTTTVTATNPSNSGLTVGSTANLVQLNPIIFTGSMLGGLIADTKYYIAKVIDSQTFSVSTSLISLSVTDTEETTNLITVNSTVGLVINNPIKFTGTTFGGLIAETTYYILAVNDGYTFTVSQTPGGGAVALSTASGLVTARTAPAAAPVISTSGAMTGTSTSTKSSLTLGQGSMNGTFSTSLFGGVVLGTTYYINTIDAGNKQFTITATQGSGSPVALTSKTGSMNLAAVGWDHINIGTPTAELLDSSSVYFIEPRTEFSSPSFSQVNTSSTTVQLAPGTSWKAIAYGKNYWIALPSGNSTAAGSSDGAQWTSITLPSVQSWTDIAYGNSYWVAISSNGGPAFAKAIYSKSNGQGWRTVELPSAGTWSNLVYGNGKFVAIAAGSSNAAYSATYGASWNSASGLPNLSWTGLAYGNGRFVAVASGTQTGAYSTNGTTWTSMTLPSSTTWSSVAFGENLFVAVSSTSSKAAYSIDGVTWYQTNLSIAADKIVYGQGVFVAMSATSTNAWILDGSMDWKAKTITNDGYADVVFGYAASTYDGKFVTLAGQSTGSVIYAGATTKARVQITSGTVTSLAQWEPGSNYTSAPTVTFTDPNVTSLAVVEPRISNGVLGSPSFVNRGYGYNTTSTLAKITGNGFADQFQTGLTITLNNLTKLPQPGDNLTITGVDQIYKVTSATVVYGTTVPNLEANIDISPAMTTALSPANGVSVEIRAKYSQARLTNHDFLNIGYGTFESSNYPGTPDSGYSALSQNQTVEANYGRVFYTSTDQDGNFKVGNLFGVQQATGIVTLSASQFGLTGLETLSLGGIAVGGSGVVVKQFSTDTTFTANSDEIIPTQRAIKAYLSSRLSQGGSNTFTGQFTAGSIVVGGPNKISSSVANGYPGSVIKMQNKVVISAVDGAMAALDYFIRGSTRKTK